jgi:hypothetical protein
MNFDYWTLGSSNANNGQGNALYIIASYTNIPLDNALRRNGEKLLVFQYTNSECSTVDSITGPADPNFANYIFTDTLVSYDLAYFVPKAGATEKKGCLITISCSVATPGGVVITQNLCTTTAATGVESLWDFTGSLTTPAVYLNPKFTFQSRDQVSYTTGTYVFTITATLTDNNSITGATSFNWILFD